MQSVQTVIEARWIIPIVPKNTVLEHHAVVIDQGRILAVLPVSEAQARYAAAETVLLKESVLMPGLVNLHSHAAMNLLRGLGADLPLMDWLTQKIWPAEGKLMSAEFVEEGAHLAGREMAAAGITCTSDQYFFPDAAARGLRRAGLRCAVSGIVIGFPSAWASDEGDYLTKAETLLQNASNDPFVTATIAPHAPYTVSDSALERCAALSAEYNAPIHIHLQETAGEVTDSIKAYGERPSARLARCGLMNERLIAVHSVHMNDEDIARLAEAGASVCHCPSSNLKLASGFAPIAAFMKAGINLGIGTDSVASNDKLDLLGETRLAALLAKGATGDPTVAKVHDMLEAATLGGARALKLDHEIGSLEKGKAADLIAVDLSSVCTLPVLDPAAQLLYSAGRENVTHTWVSGNLIASRQQISRFIDLADIQSLNRTAEQWHNRL